MREGQKRINIYIPEDLYSLVLNSEYNMTEAIIKGLTDLLEAPKEDFDNKANTNTQGDSNTLNSELVKSLQNHIASLENQLKVKDNQLDEQLKAKDKQIENRDTEIANLTETIQKQVVNIYNLSNQKALEAPAEKEIKKPWWKVW
jgi:tRNA U34 5-carboxymethylaminomethyl modifying GTPase MnmE/TrmE